MMCDNLGRWTGAPGAARRSDACSGDTLQDVESSVPTEHSDAESERLGWCVQAACKARGGACWSTGQKAQRDDWRKLHTAILVSIARAMLEGVKGLLGSSGPSNWRMPDGR